jgi:hypothetical protein
VGERTPAMVTAWVGVWVKARVAVAVCGAGTRGQFCCVSAGAWARAAFG